MKPVPEYAMRAYAVLYTTYGIRESFTQAELEWVVGESMRKKIFAVLLGSGWLTKVSRRVYRCAEPGSIFSGMASFRVHDIMQEAKRPYAFTRMSAIEIWSDYSYVQRSIKKSPYHLEILRQDIAYWKGFFSERGIPSYVGEGSTVGEYVTLYPLERVQAVERHGVRVIPYRRALRMAEENELFSYAAEYMREHHAAA